MNPTRMNSYQQLKEIERQKRQEARLARAKAEQAWLRYDEVMGDMVDNLGDLATALEKKVEW